jgi:RNA polymerase sigma-70 factor (ECF subfamily)
VRISGRQQDSAPGLVDFAALYREHAGGVHRFALFLCGNREVADDLTSEAFLRVWTARSRVDLTTVRAYLFAIVRNLFLQHLQRERRRAPLQDDHVDGEPDPETRMGGRSDLRVVLAALRALPEIDKTALLMRADGALPYDEIGRALGISTTAAKVKVHRARLKLAESLHSAEEKGTRS